MKAGPALSMVIVVGLAMWLTFGLGGGLPKEARPGAAVFELLLAHEKLTVEQFRVASDGEAPAHFEYRFLNAREMGDAPMTEDEFQSTLMRLGGGGSPRHPVLQFSNVTSWGNLLWLALGFGGQALFSARMIVQWIASERRGEPHVPASFWYISFIAGLVLCSYFIWRRDPVGVLGQSTGLVIYVRNIRLHYKHGQLHKSPQ